MFSLVVVYEDQKPPVWIEFKERPTFVLTTVESTGDRYLTVEDSTTLFFTEMLYVNHFFLQKEDE